MVIDTLRTILSRPNGSIEDMAENRNIIPQHCAPTDKATKHPTFFASDRLKQPMENSTTKDVHRPDDRSTQYNNKRFRRIGASRMREGTSTHYDQNTRSYPNREYNAYEQLQTQAKYHQTNPLRTKTKKRLNQPQYRPHLHRRKKN